MVDFTDFDDEGKPGPRMRRTYTRQQPYQETIFVNADRGDTSLNRVSVPFLLVLVGGVALVGLTWGAASQFGDVKATLQRLEERIINATDTISRRVDRLEYDLESKTRDRYTQTDHTTWCNITEAVNVNNGWKCGRAPEKQRPPEYAPRLKGWTTEPPRP